ncbi:MAG: DUF2851 family protein [Bacteroidaceae bacterium]|nr:DUF2851 family protein [Bacteroidaceae bacterium]
MEQLLHYVWKHRILPLGKLCTTSGQEVEVIDPGLHNHDAGPDFFNAKVRIGGQVWVGNVEIHLRSSDWQRHGHQLDPAYNNVILHVAEVVDAEVVTQDGKQLPQLCLPIPEDVSEHYAELCRTEDYPRCWRIIPSLSRLTVHSWMSALLAERLAERAQRCLDWLKAVDGDWERTLFVALARNFGFGVNGDAFEAWGKALPLHAAAKHRDDLFQLEALFLGTAGLLALEAVPPTARQAAAEDSYFLRLQREWTYLKHKFQLPEPMAYKRWRYLRLRPQNFPHLRIVQLANLYFRGTASFAALMKASSREALHTALDAAPSDYWQRHYLFGLESRRSEKHLSPSSRDLIIINTVCPMLFGYGEAHNDPSVQERAVELLEELRPEQNYIIRQWQQCGVEVASAADSQALIQLKRIYCDRKDCLRCRFGFEYLKRK